LVLDSTSRPRDTSSTPTPVLPTTQHCDHLDSVTPVLGAEEVVEEMNIEVTTTATFVEADAVVDEETRDKGEDEGAGTRMTELAEVLESLRGRSC
jgi:hypothetical protein